MLLTAEAAEERARTRLASLGLALVDDIASGKGRGVIFQPELRGSSGSAAGAVLRPGDVVGRFDAIVATAKHLQRAERCATCFTHVGTEETPSKKCSACQISRYCSVVCQRSDWQLGHRVECKRLQVSLLFSLCICV
jgi:MYND finger